MKQRLFILLLLVIPLSCQVPGDKTSQPSSKGDPFQLYLTYDIAINSCLISWEQIEAFTLNAALRGDLAVYAKPYSDLIPNKERKNAFAFKAMDLSTGSEQAIPMETILLQRIDNGFKLLQISPFDNQEVLAGYIKSADLTAILPTSSASFLLALERYKKLPAQGKNMDGSTVYTASMLLLDTLQKELAYLVEEKKQFTLWDEYLKPMSDSLFDERSHQLSDSLGTDNRVYVKRVRIPEYDLWKGIMAYGSVNQERIEWSAFGLLYHPNSKFGSFNPGKILWFAVPANELEEKEPRMHQLLHSIAQNALLYSLDPAQYKSTYYLNNSIEINNVRYKGGR